MITLEELNKHNFPCDETTTANLTELCRRMNIVREAFNKPMIVNSSLRSQAYQMRINPDAPNSKHVTGQAVDIHDITGQLWNWCEKNMPLLENVGLWLENRGSTPSWVHFQSEAPRSGRRVFKP